MLAEILEHNRSLLASTESYLKPQLDKIICLAHTLEKHAGDDYADAFNSKVLHKGDYLLQEGTVCRHIWFLEKGIARVFDRKDGVEVTRYFFFPGEIIDDYCSSALQVPSEVNIEVIQDSVVYAISRNALRELTARYPIISELKKLILECHTIWLEKRVYDIQHCNATEHYRHMLQHQIPIIRNVPVTYIASYLGISLETLSRIRSKIAKETRRETTLKITDRKTEMIKKISYAHS